MHHVLVVDDDDDIRQSLEDLLLDEGFSVLTAGNGAEALEVLERGVRPCLVLVDLLMPVMDGVEFIERLRAHERFADLPTVIISAASTAKPPPGIRLLRKPIGYDVLLHEVEKVCSRRGGALTN